MANKRAFCGLLGLALLAGCSRVIRSGPIIAGYKNAECIPAHFGAGITPPTPTWDYSLTTSVGHTVRVVGAQMPGGRIGVRHESDGADIIAANAGDYIYPADVRMDGAREKLFVRASGITAAFSQHQTWLFEFDLDRRRQIDHARVDPNVLPQESKIE